MKGSSNTVVFEAGAEMLDIMVILERYIREHPDAPEVVNARRLDGLLSGMEARRGAVPVGACDVLGDVE